MVIRQKEHRVSSLNRETEAEALRASLNMMQVEARLDDMSQRNDLRIVGCLKTMLYRSGR